MADAAGRPTLYVEGKDDLNSILHVMYRHGVDCREDRPNPSNAPLLSDREGKNSLLEIVQTAIKASSTNTVGFVLDADSPIQSRWDAIRGRLATQEIGINTPSSPVGDGFVGTSSSLKTRVGVWLMPDNQQDGTLETFLRMLIAEEDHLIGHAESATDQAKALEAPFADKDRLQAVMHTWLAWQQEPGRPYGTAIRARYFDATKPAGQAFAAWFKKLYQIE